jgi:hypothetical protein
LKDSHTILELGVGGADESGVMKNCCSQLGVGWEGQVVKDLGSKPQLLWFGDRKGCDVDTADSGLGPGWDPISSMS